MSSKNTAERLYFPSTTWLIRSNRRRINIKQSPENISCQLISAHHCSCLNDLLALSCLKFGAQRRLGVLKYTPPPPPSKYITCGNGQVAQSSSKNESESFYGGIFNFFSVFFPGLCPQRLPSGSNGAPAQRDAVETVLI